MSKLNQFSKKEEKGYNKFVKFRDFIFSPFMETFVKLRFTPNLLTFFGIFVILWFPIFFYWKDYFSASIVLLLHLLFDGLDGVYARYQKKDNEKGKLFDLFADYLGFIIVVITLIYFNFANGAIGAFYLAMYIIMMFLIIIRNYMGLRSEFILKSKYILYGLILFFAIFGINWFDFLMMFFSFSMLIQNCISFYKIRKYIY